ncbi:CBS domain protein [Desulfamplus magnetovallimortis]|uniref:CBS domain protein n=1 Tax=Desulfamplus magnetovallimortis TaxID=1246637 RepID=A0A1W1H567_9BACT|nr:CBS domain-containing protein [Desulfamplus magnetovallimortis]SLM27621.1 CBS domain protein [Desulfamplus magnetovallimortis]
MLVKDLLLNEKQQVHSLDCCQTVADALKIMSAYHVSGLLVMDGKSIAGIFTERDLLRCHVIFPDTPVKEIALEKVMSSRLVVAEPEDEIKDAMAMMIKAGIRHLPVVSGGEIRGILSIEELVKSHVGALTQELHYLQDYVSDLQDAVND